MSNPRSPLLEAVGLTKSFGGLAAVKGVSFQLFAGEILGLIGPNGAGKSTVINLLTGYEVPDSGYATIEGRRVTGLPADRVARLGLRRTFQTPRVFRRLTVRENRDLPIVAGSRSTSHLDGVMKVVAASAEDRRLAATLPVAARRLLEIERACVGATAAILLDEPSSGLAELEKATVASAVRAVARDGVAVLLVAHDIPFVVDLCHRIIVLALGEVIAVGTPQDIARNQLVIEAYLGQGATMDVN